MTRTQILIQALFPVVAIWIILFGIGQVLGAKWPKERLSELSTGGGIGYQTFILSILVISVFMLKARIAVWNTHRNQSTDWLAWSFAWLDTTIVMFLVFSIFSNMWPQFRWEHGEIFRAVYQLLELNVFIAAVFFLYHFMGAIIDGRLRPPEKE